MNVSNLIKCKDDLINWLETKPYHNPSIGETFKYNSSQNIIICYLSDIIKMVRCKAHFSSITHHKYLLEHIGNILLKNNVFSINISGYVYIWKNGKWKFSCETQLSL